jgi:hypothetical protein
MFPSPFKSFLMGGFECSTHRPRSRRRLDMIAATRHDELAHTDYSRLQELGIQTARDGLRWHLIEREPGRFDLSSVANQVAAARATGTQVIWDYFHYGYPDDIDIMTDEFVERFAAFSMASTEFLVAELGPEIVFCPVNEISFFSWAAGRAGVFHPFAKTRATAIKRQLVKCVITVVNAIRTRFPRARWVLTEPAIHVVPSPGCSVRGAAQYRSNQFQALDMVSGRVDPELGGSPDHIDMIGLNYYDHNQWTQPGRRPIRRSHPLFRPPHQIFNEFYIRYGRPLLIAETGIENERRADWFRYMAAEARASIAMDIPLLGLCLYPVVNHPGWDDSRHCHNGLWDYADETGARAVHEPLETAIREFQL